MALEPRRVLAEINLPLGLSTFAALCAAFEAEFPQASAEMLPTQIRIWSRP